MQLIKKIKGGAKFEDVAKAESTDNSKTNGGDLGWFTLARMVKPFGDAVKNSEERRHHQEPVQTQYGWHIIKLEDTRDAPFDQMKGSSAMASCRRNFGLYRRPEEERQDREDALTIICGKQ
jgi:peptidyl-prolyl cis-trans isomerase C